MRILLTGATGALGSELLLRLLAEGHEMICITRPLKKKSAYERIKDLVCDSSLLERTTVLEGDICKPLCGLSQDTIKSLGLIDCVVHSAASVEFDEIKSVETWNTNLHGTDNFLNLLSQLKICSLHHVSTAYISGGLNVFSEEDIDIGQSPRNPYEGSKLAGEKLVRRWSEEKGIPISIHRPSIIVGHSRTGVTRTFDGYYGFFHPMWGLKRRQIKDMWEVGIFIKCSNESTINLIPSDWLINTMSPIISGENYERTYNLVHPEPPKVKWVIETSLDILGIKALMGVGSRPNTPLDTSSIKRAEKIQKMIDRGLGRYHPYVTRETNFLSENAKTVLGRKYNNPPPITAELLKVLLDFAETEWST